MISYREEIKRKAVHLSSLWMPLAIIFLSKYWKSYIIGLLFLTLAIFSLLVERAYAQKRVNFFTRLYGKLFGEMLRHAPRNGEWMVSGGVPVLLAVAFCSLIFPTVIAASALTTMLLGDAFAALIGRKWGLYRFPNDKSLGGFLAFVCFAGIGVTCVFLLTRQSLENFIWIVPAVVVGAIAEFCQCYIKLDDNFLIPSVVGGFLWLVL